MRLVSTWREALPSREVRLLAHMADWFFIYCISLGGGYAGAFLAAAMTSVQGAPSRFVENAATSGMSLGIVFWGFTAFFVDFIAIQGLTGASVGKTICGLKVIRADGAPLGVVKAFWRSVLYVPSMVPMNLGFLAIFSSERSQCWHDRICETYVVHADVKLPSAVLFPGSAGSGSAGPIAEEYRPFQDVA